MLHQLLENVDRIESLVVVVTWDDNTVATHWSKQKLKELAWAARALQIEADELIRDAYTEDR